MKNSKIILTMIFLSFGFLIQQQAQAQVTLSKGVLGSGGAALSDSSFHIVGTLGQPFIGVVQDHATVSNVGFWNLPTELISTSVEETPESAPTTFRLDQNYPNPFNPSTTIQFALPQPSKVTVHLFDVLGRQVSTLVNEELGAGDYKILFEARDLASGLYVYRIRAEGFVQSKKLMVLK